MQSPIQHLTLNQLNIEKRIIFLHISFSINVILIEISRSIYSILFLNPLYPAGFLLGLIILVVFNGL